MSKAVAILMIAVVCALAASPAFADATAPVPLTDEESKSLTAEDTAAVDAVGDVTGGLTHGQETFLTVAGVITVAVLLAIWIF